ncbi:MAG: hypothetical protein MHPSP_003896, partial [Paramarteilia canceri]
PDLDNEQDITTSGSNSVEAENIRDSLRLPDLESLIGENEELSEESNENSENILNISNVLGEYQTSDSLNRSQHENETFL